ncbi:MAG: glycosyltransferase family 4 protein [Armatimonadota bacterium]
MFVVPFSDIGGSEQYVLDHLRCLDRAKYEPLLVSLRPGDIVEAARALGVPSFALQPHKTREIPKVLAAIRELSHIIKQERIDLVFGNQGSMLLYCGLAAMPLRRPVVWAVHDPLKGSGVFERAFVTAQRRIRPAWTIANSPSTLESYLSAYPNIRGRHSVIFPGTDLALLAEGADAARARTKFRIPDHAPLISQLARLQSSKGHLDLIPAAVKVLNCYPDTRFLIVGDTQFGIEPEYKARVLSAIAEANISNSVLMPGYVSEPDKRDILAATDILVHPAAWEPFGISVIEGMGAGKPVVAAASAGPSLSVVHGQTGYLSPIADSERLADAILKLLNDPAGAKAMGAAGQQRVLENYTVQGMVRQTESIFDSLLLNR